MDPQGGRIDFGRYRFLIQIIALPTGSCINRTHLKSGFDRSRNFSFIATEGSRCIRLLPPSARARAPARAQGVDVKIVHCFREEFPVHFPVCEKRSHGSCRGSLFTAFLLLILLFPVTGTAGEDDDKLTLGEFTEHIISTFEVIGEIGLDAAVGMKRTVEDGVTIIDYFTAYHREGFEEFTGGRGAACVGPCLEFRDQLVELLRHQQEVMNLIPPTLGAYAEIQGLEPLPALPPADLSALLDVLDQAPAFVLYPLYDAIKTITGDAGEGMGYLNLLFTDAEEALRDVIDVGRTQAAAGTAYTSRIQSSGSRHKTAAENVNGYSCQVVSDELSRTKLLVAAPVLKLFAGGMYWIGDSIILSGMNMVEETKWGVSLVGEMSSNTSVNAAATLGEILRLIGKVSEGISKGIFNTVNTCRLRLNNQLMFCMLTEKNLHDTKKYNSLEKCTKWVKAGDENFGFKENWLEELEQLP